MFKYLRRTVRRVWLAVAAPLLCGVTVALTGCSTVSKPPWQARSFGDKQQAEEVYRVVWADETLQHHDLLRVAKVIPERLPNNKLKIYCELLNRSSNDLNIQVQTAFKDSMGRIVEETPWQTFMMSALAGNEYTVTSVRTDVDDYLVRMRLTTRASVID